MKLGRSALGPAGVGSSQTCTTMAGWASDGGCSSWASPATRRGPPSGKSHTLGTGLQITGKVVNCSLTGHAWHSSGPPTVAGSLRERVGSHGWCPAPHRAAGLHVAPACGWAPPSCPRAKGGAVASSAWSSHNEHVFGLWQGLLLGVTQFHNTQSHRG